MNKIILDNIEFLYQIQRKPIRSIRLKLLSKNLLLISCPSFTPDLVISRFIKTNSDWVIKHSQKLVPKKSLLDLKSLRILDKDFIFIILNTQRDSVVINEDELKIYANISKLTESHVKTILEKRLRTYSLTLIKFELKKLSDTYHFNYSRVTVKNQKSRYGSCSSQGNLNFNWQIILFPYDKFRHILLHELTHLKIKNHSKTFWNQLSIYDPNYKKNNLWLKSEANKLFIV
jgi:predicted metal-dependent hydrolase